MHSLIIKAIRSIQLSFVLCISKRNQVLIVVPWGFDGRETHMLRNKI
jgi:hypothetical protein